MSSHNGNGLLGKFVLIQKVTGRILPESSSDDAGAGSAKRFNSPEEILAWEEFKKLSEKEKKNLLYAKIEGEAHDL